MRGITKTFPGVKALRTSISRCDAGEIHAIVGENGAGKSTLMKVLSGVYPHGTYDGEIIFDGEERALQRHPRQRAARASSSSTRNWRWCRCCRSPRTSSSATSTPRAASSTGTRPIARTPRAARARSACSEPPDTLITDIGVGKQQLVEIAKALSKEVKLLILDEPTASLNETDSDALLDLLLELQGAGHHLDPDLAQAQRDRQGRRLASPSCATAGPSRRSTAATSRSARTASSAAWSAATWRDRYPAARRRRSARPCSRSRTGRVHHPLHADRAGRSRASTSACSAARSSASPA